MSVWPGMTSLRIWRRDISQFQKAGVGSLLPAASTARIDTECVPAPSPVRVAGEVQLFQAAPSRLQLNMAMVSGEEKVKVATDVVDGVAGPLAMVVSGGTVSTAQAKTAGEESADPRASTARTLNV